MSTAAQAQRIDAELERRREDAVLEEARRIRHARHEDAIQRRLRGDCSGLRSPEQPELVSPAEAAAILDQPEPWLVISAPLRGITSAQGGYSRPDCLFARKCLDEEAALGTDDDFVDATAIRDASNGYDPTTNRALPLTPDQLRRRNAGWRALGVRCRTLPGTGFARGTLQWSAWDLFRLIGLDEHDFNDPPAELHRRFTGYRTRKAKAQELAAGRPWPPQSAIVAGAGVKAGA